MATPIKLDRAKVDYAALSSPQVRAQLRIVAEAAAARARNIGASEGVKSDPSEIKVAMGGHRRARAYVRAVSPSAAAREAKYRILGRAMPGLRGGDR